MELQTAKLLAYRLMLENLKPHGWTFGWDNAVQSLGQCDYNRRRITLSRQLTAGADEVSVRDTILHEIAHANVGPGHGHGRVWMTEAIRLGASPRSRHSVGTVPNLRKELAPWVGTCPAGHVSPYRFWRKPRVDRSCAMCNPRKFDRANLVTYVDIRGVRV